MEFAYGADLSWVSQLEAEGIRWVADDGAEADPFIIAAKKGVNAARFRVFVEPPEDFMWQKDEKTLCQLGYCDPKHIIASVKRAAAAGFRLMIDFHYSDHFADPQYQDIPAAWTEYSADELYNAIFSHTTEVLNSIKAEGITPEWVQVGNEINMGILLPQGSASENPAIMAKLLNGGYRAVKAVFPKCQVITHLTAFHKPQYIEGFLDSFFENGGCTDILGFSHYPYWFNMYAREENDRVYPTAEFVTEYMEHYSLKYERPVMICEVGEHEDNADAAYELISNTIHGLKALPDEKGLGVFYWEPAANSAVLSDGYPLGATALVGEKKLRYTRALDAYKSNK